MNIGATELLLLLLLVVLLFGASRLPKLARSIREAQRELRAGSSEETEPETDPKAEIRA